MSNEKDETRKELVVGAAGVLAVLAGVPGVLAAGVTALLGIGFARIKGHDQRRAAELFVRMAERDESPAAFLNHLHERLEADDENTLTAFRTLMLAAVEAVSRDAIAPLGFVGRRFIRGECPSWIARGIVDVLQKLESAEIDALRKTLLEIESIRSDRVTLVAELRPDRGWRGYQQSVPEPFVPVTPFPSARRLFGYLKRAGLGTDTSAFGIGGSPEVIDLERVASDVLREALVATQAR